MQVANLKIQNFKGIGELEISFLDDLGHVRPVTLLLGDNGSGKTSVLQAIALALSLATNKTLNARLLDWPGFLIDRVGSLGETRIELQVAFTEDELEAVQRFEQRDRRVFQVGTPSTASQINLIFEHGEVWAKGGHGLDQLLARYGIAEVTRWAGERPGDVFWFHQNRNVQTVSELREELIRAWAFKMSPRGRGAGAYLDVIEKQFAELFPGTRFVGVEPRMIGGAPSGTEAYFLLEREGRVYDIAEMSSGEQAVFPLLYEFVRLGIARSVVLIDELELHLHPPQQQALMAALRRIGPDCQFIVTSHSPYLESMTPDEEEIRLPGGRRCL